MHVQKMYIDKKNIQHELKRKKYKNIMSNLYGFASGFMIFFSVNTSACIKTVFISSCIPGNLRLACQIES